MLSFRRKTIKPELNLTPLIDMVFLLLIFFLLTANFLREEGMPVNLPAAKNATLQNEASEMTVFINAAGEIFINKTPVDLSKLYQIFSDKVKQTGRVTVVIKADKAAPVEWVIKVMDRAKLAGVKKLFIATEKEIGHE